MVDIELLLRSIDINKVLPQGVQIYEINRKTFKYIILASDVKKQLSDGDIDLFLRMVSDDTFIEFMQEPFEKQGYTLVDHRIIKLLDKVEIKNDTYVFVNETYLNRLLIKGYFRYEWVLKAMAVDYSKYLDKDLLETFKEYFDGNTRLIEQLIKEQKCSLDNHKWIMDFDHNVLYYPVNKKKIQWTKEEAESKFKILKEGF